MSAWSWQERSHRLTRRGAVKAMGSVVLARLLECSSVAPAHARARALIWDASGMRRSRSAQRANLRWPFVGKRERERKVSGRAFSSFGGPPCKPLTSFFRHFHPGEFGARLIRTGCGSEEPVSAPRPREWLHGAPPGTPLVTDSPGVDLSAGAMEPDGRSFAKDGAAAGLFIPS